MKLVKPIAVTDSILTSSTLLENDFAAWNSSTAYVAGNKVIVMATHHVYESLTSNTNKYPPTYLTGSTPNWLDLGATNKWKMFDESYNSQSISTSSPLTVVLNPGQIINTLAIMNISGATSLNIVGVVGENTVYSKTISLYIGGLGDWYEYFFSPIELKSNIVLTDIPAYFGIQLTISLSGTTPSLGIMQMGFCIHLGDTLYGAKSGIENYSRKEKDDFGNYYIVPRKFSKTLSADILVADARIGYIQNLLSQYKDSPVLWIGDENYEATIIYGFYTDFSIVMQNWNGSFCSLEIEGLT